MGDNISRQAAIDAVNKIAPVDTEYDCTLLDRIDVRYVLTELPSAQPNLQPTCNQLATDNISRHAVIQLIYNSYYNLAESSEDVDSMIEDVEALPSTDRIGHWILDPDGNDWNLPAWICSECHRKNDNIGVVEKGIGSDPRNWGGSKFCPECGARMSGTPKIWKKRCL